MKTRSSLEICLPLVLCVVGGVASLPTLVLCGIWVTLGVCSIGHHSLEELPAYGTSIQAWLRWIQHVLL